MNETPRDRRLRVELEKMKLLTEHSSLISYDARGEDPEHPEEYMVTFRCKGFRKAPPPPSFLPSNWRDDPGWIADTHIAYINLPATFPRTPPQVRFQTPLFHPNIRQFPATPELLLEQLFKDFGSGIVSVVEQAGGFDNMLMYILKTPEIRDRVFSSYICIDVLFPPEHAGAYRAGVTLYDLCLEVGKMIMMQRFNLKHGLNDAAIEWTKEAVKWKQLLPVDKSIFLDKLAIPVIEIPTEVEIEILDDSEDSSEA